MLFVLTFDFITNDNNNAHERSARNNEKKKTNVHFEINDVQVKAKVRPKKRTESHTQRGQSDMRASESEIMAVFSLNGISDFDEESSKKNKNK